MPRYTGKVVDCATMTDHLWDCSAQNGTRHGQTDAAAEAEEVREGEEGIRGCSDSKESSQLFLSFILTSSSFLIERALFWEPFLHDHQFNEKCRVTMPIFAPLATGP